MKIPLALICLLLSAAPTTAFADACDDTAARIAAAVPGLIFKARHDPKPPPAGIVPSETVEVHFGHRYGGTVEIICHPSMQPIVTIDTDSAYPSKEFLDLTAKIGAAETGASTQKIRTAVALCHRRAIKSPATADDADISGAGVHCVIYNDPDLKKTQFEITKR